MFDFDLLADLPAPRDDEPPSLRDDIVDELADHLQCALRRELLKDSDETTVEQRVLNRFGDPKKLARRLWWQAMWSRMMGQRILSGLQWMLTLAAVVLAGAVFWQQGTLLQEIRTAREEDAAQRSVLTALLNRIGQPNASEPSFYPGPPPYGFDSGYPPGLSAPEGKRPPTLEELAEQKSSIPSKANQSLTIKLVQETADGPPVTASALQVIGGGINVEPQPVWETAENIEPIENESAPIRPKRLHTGKYILRLDQPNRYELLIQLPDGQHCKQSVLVRPNEHRELTVICPKPREQALVTVIAPPLPKELQALNCELEIQLNDCTTTVDGVEWHATSPNLQRVKFDPQGGPIVEIQNQANGETTGLRGSKSEERVIVLLSGPLRYSYQIAPRMDRSANVFGVVPVTEWPEDGSALTHEIAPGETQWKLELPKGLLAEAKRRLSTSRPAPNPAAYAPVTNDEASEAEAVTPSHEAALTIKLVQETADGPQVSDAQLRLEGRYGRVAGRELSQPVTVTRMGDGKEISEVVPRATGEYLFQVQEPGRYQLKIQLADGQSCEQSILLRSKEHHERTVICPKPREQALVTLTAPPLPKELQTVKCELEIVLNDSITTIDGVDWRAINANYQRVTFDPAGGLAVAIRTEPNGETTNLRRSKPEERAVVLLSGSVQFNYHVSPQIDAFVGMTSVAVWPNDNSSLTHDVTPGENQWEVELPDELLKEATEMFVRGKAQRVRQPAKPVGVPDPVDDESAGDSSGAQLRADGQAAALTVKLVEEGDDGSAVTGATVTLVKLGAVIASQAIAEKKDDGDRLFHNTGRYGFKNLLPERYNLRIELADGQRSERSVLMRPKDERELTIVCPKPREKALVLITGPQLPEKFQKPGTGIKYAIEELPIVLNGVTWQLPEVTRYRIDFDGQTRQPGEVDVTSIIDGSEYGSPNIDLSKSSPEERAVFLLTGPVQASFLDYGPAGEFDSWPDPDADSVIRYTVSPEENRWEMELTPQAKRFLNGELPTGKIRPAEAATNAETPSDSPVAQPDDDGPAVLTVKLVQETADGPPVNDAVVLLNHGRYDLPPQRTNREGSYSFVNLSPERYELRVDLPNSQQTSRQEVLIRDDQPRELTVICPRPRKNASVLITAPPLPDDLQAAGLRLDVDYQFKGFPVGETAWFNNQWTEIETTFDPATGRIAVLTQEEVNSGREGKRKTDLSRVKDEDRVIFMRPGSVSLVFILWSPEDRVVIWPPHDAVPSPEPILRTVKPGENRWELELPEELLQEARAMFAGGNPSGVPGPAIAKPTPSSPGAQTSDEPLGDNCRLIVKLTTGTKDGPPPDHPIVTLLDEKSLLERGGPPRATHSEGFSRAYTAQTDGILTYNQLEPGRYTLEVNCRDGLQTSIKLPLLRPGQERTQHVICPPAAKKRVANLTVSPAPEDLRNLGLYLTATLRMKPIALEDSEWKIADAEKTLLFDQRTGLPQAVVGPEGHMAVDLARVPAEDRAVIMPSGPYQLAFQLRKTIEGNNLFGKVIATWHEEEDLETGRVLGPGNNKWDIEIPQAFWDEAREKLQ